MRGRFSFFFFFFVDIERLAQLCIIISPYRLNSSEKVLLLTHNLPQVYLEVPRFQIRHLHQVKLKFQDVTKY